MKIHWIKSNLDPTKIHKKKIYATIDAGDLGCCNSIGEILALTSPDKGMRIDIVFLVKTAKEEGKWMTYNLSQVQAQNIEKVEGNQNYDFKYNGVLTP